MGWTLDEIIVEDSVVDGTNVDDLVDRGVVLDKTVVLTICEAVLVGTSLDVLIFVELIVVEASVVDGNSVVDDSVLTVCVAAVVGTSLDELIIVVELIDVEASVVEVDSVDEVVHFGATVVLTSL